MMGTHPHHPMVVPIAGKELRQALIAILTSGTTKEGIITFDPQIFNMIILLIIRKDKGIGKHALLWFT